MASKVDTFIEQAETEMTQIRQRIQQAALDAQVLANRWAALGKNNMAGWTEYAWGGKPYTEAELRAALNGLSVVVDTADAVSLLNMHTAMRAIDRIVKASL